MTASMPVNSGTLPLTGERTVPGVPAENYWFRRHEAAYEYLAPLLEGCTAVEVGCGEGYGTALLARSTQRIVGVDYDALTIAHAAATYPQGHFVRGNLAALPIGSESVDAVATLQVVEHVWNHREFVRQCLRVLRPGGRLLMTTPNRLTFSPGLDAPVNPFHTKEFDAHELSELLERDGFVIDGVLGLHAGTRLAEFDARHGGSFVDAQLAGPPDEWPARLVQDVVSVVTSDFVIVSAGAREVGECLDLVVVAHRPLG
jgi:SAM-dependent methyltransferase